MKQLYCRLVQDDMVNTPVSPGHLSSDLAVIGMSGRFPQCPSIYAFWDFLSKDVTLRASYLRIYGETRN